MPFLVTLAAWLKGWDRQSAGCPVNLSTALVHTEMSQQLLNGLQGISVPQRMNPIDFGDPLTLL